MSGQERVDAVLAETVRTVSAAVVVVRQEGGRIGLRQLASALECEAAGIRQELAAGRGTGGTLGTVVTGRGQPRAGLD